MTKSGTLSTLFVLLALLLLALWLLRSKDVVTFKLTVGGIVDDQGETVPVDLGTVNEQRSR